MSGRLTRTPTLVTDNGTCFTARKFQKHIEFDYEHVRIQYRVPQQLGLLEWFHATLKQEEVHWLSYSGPTHARECLAEFRQRYNEVRPHWALRPDDGGDPLTPADVYEHDCVEEIPKWQGWASEALRKRQDADCDPAKKYSDNWTLKLELNVILRCRTTRSKLCIEI